MTCWRRWRAGRASSSAQRYLRSEPPKGPTAMNPLIKTLAALAACTVLTPAAFCQTKVVPIDIKPARKLICDPPIPGPLAAAVVFIPYSVQNSPIPPVCGPPANNVSPRVGHLHVTVDDLP